MEQQYLELYLFRNELIAFKPKLSPFTSAPCDHHFYQRLKTGFPNSRQTRKVFTVFNIPLRFNLTLKQIIFFSPKTTEQKIFCTFSLVLQEIFV